MRNIPLEPTMSLSIKDNVCTLPSSSAQLVRESLHSSSASIGIDDNVDKWYLRSSILRDYLANLTKRKPMKAIVADGVRPPSKATKDPNLVFQCASHFGYLSLQQTITHQGDTWYAW